MVPVERIELPTFGLQNRCSTAELNRRIKGIGRSNIRLVDKGPEPQTRPAQPKIQKKVVLGPPLSSWDLTGLLAGVLPSVFAAEPGTRGQTKGEWRVISYGNTLHGFTNPAADGSMLRKRALQCAGRSLLLSSMRGLFDEVLA
jgi:hypothetical protein